MVSSRRTLRRNVQPRVIRRRPIAPIGQRHPSFGTQATEEGEYNYATMATPYSGYLDRLTRRSVRRAQMWRGRLGVLTRNNRNLARNYHRAIADGRIRPGSDHDMSIRNTAASLIQQGWRDNRLRRTVNTPGALADGILTQQAAGQRRDQIIRRGY